MIIIFGNFDAFQVYQLHLKVLFCFDLQVINQLIEEVCLLLHAETFKCIELKATDNRNIVKYCRRSTNSAIILRMVLTYFDGLSFSPVEIIIKFCSFHSTDSLTHKLICLEEIIFWKSNLEFLLLFLTLFICFLRPGRKAILAACSNSEIEIHWWFQMRIHHKTERGYLCLVGGDVFQSLCTEDVVSCWLQKVIKKCIMYICSKTTKCVWLNSHVLADNNLLYFYSNQCEVNSECLSNQDLVLICSKKSLVSLTWPSSSSIISSKFTSKPL